MNQCDLLVIGAGPGGYETAARGAAMGLKVTLVERDKLGGTCLNRGCIPTKALCRAAEVADTIAAAAEFGIECPSTAFDYRRVAARRDAIVDGLREGVAHELRGVEIVAGEAVFENSHTVRVDDALYTAPRIIVATGSAPAALPVVGAGHALTSDGFLALDTLPPSAGIIGGGVIGLEFASILRSFGVDVTVIEAAPEILPQFDAEIAKRLRMALKRRGISVVTSAMVSEITPDGAILYSSKGKSKTLASAMAIMAVGRRPVIPQGLVEAGAGLTPRGFLDVDSSMQTTLPGVYAIGDVNGQAMLAHVATAQGEIVLGLRSDMGFIPGVVFTRPECAMVGFTEEECVARGLDMRILRSSFQANGKARAMGEPDGMVKLIIDPTEDCILGCHILGPHASDLIAEATLAMSNGLTASEVAWTIHAHPTLAEALAAACRR